VLESVFSSVFLVDYRPYSQLPHAIFASETAAAAKKDVDQFIT